MRVDAEQNLVEEVDSDSSSVGVDRMVSVDDVLSSSSAGDGGGTGERVK